LVAVGFTSAATCWLENGNRVPQLYDGFYEKKSRGGSALRLFWGLPSQGSPEDRKLTAEWLLDGESEEG
jgi:hypothetical protein